MNKIKDCNLVCTNLNNRCHLTCVERTGSVVLVFLGKVVNLVHIFLAATGASALFLNSSMFRYCW